MLIKSKSKIKAFKICNNMIFIVKMLKNIKEYLIKICLVSVGLRRAKQNSHLFELNGLRSATQSTIIVKE